MECPLRGTCLHARHSYYNFLSLRLKPDLVNYSSVLASLAKTQKLEAALKIYDEMVKVEITPDVVCMNSVMHTAANCGDVKRTLQIFQVYAMGKNLERNILLRNYVKCSNRQWPRIKFYLVYS